MARNTSLKAQIVDAAAAEHNPQEFVRKISAFAKKTNEQILALQKNMALRVYADIIQDTPVDSGLARSNWMLSVSVPNVSTTDVVTPGMEKEKINKKAVKDSALGSLVNMKRGQTIYITNSLPYILRLEYGWSKQAPQGMVRKALAKWTEVYKDALVDTKGSVK